MNEQIKELAHKAEFINKRHNGDEWRWGYIDPELSDKLEKFAMLTAKECAKVARWTDLEEVEGGDGAVLRAASEAIENYFGVK